MTKQIEIAPYANVDLNYEPLFNELNQFFTDYKNMVNKRLAFNKKKEEKREDAESDESIELVIQLQSKSLTKRLCIMLRRK